MAKYKFNAGPRRGDPKFERDYLLRMGYVQPADPLPLDPASALEQAREVVSCCELLLPIARHPAAQSDATRMVAAWLVATAATARRLIANGGMGVITPMATEAIQGQLINSRK